MSKHPHPTIQQRLTLIMSPPLLQREFVVSLHSIFVIDERMCREIVCPQGRTDASAADAMLCASEALQLGSLPGIAGSLAEGVAATPAFSVVSHASDSDL